MEFQLVNEGKAKIRVPTGKISKKLPVFYNPAMKLNRDVTIGVFRVLGRTGLKGCDLLAGSGVRSLRLLKETNGAFSHITINDANPLAAKSIKQHLAVNNIPNTKATVSNLDANELLASSTGFDYIEIDPFGSPNPFLDQSVQHLARDGILAVTATDTAALSGTSPLTCQRKYWATPMRNYLMHEIGLRILARKCQLAGAQYEKALIPVVAYSKQHYMRVIFRAEKGKRAVDALLKQHKYLHFCKKCLKFNIDAANENRCGCGRQMQTAGALWAGQLGAAKLLRAIADSAPSQEASVLLETLAGEESVPGPGFHDVHVISKKMGIPPPQTEALRKAIRASGHKVVMSHYTPLAFKTTMPARELQRMFQKLASRPRAGRQ